MQDYNASELPRVVACNGSKDLVSAIEFQPPKDDAAKEGTAAHFALECLLNGVEIPDVDTFGTEIDDDMKEFAEACKADVFDKYHKVTAQSEAKATWLATPNIRIRCKVDLSGLLVGSGAYVLAVDDYKYGYRPVDPEMNWQLIAYAIGVARQLADPATGALPFTHVRLGVYQPRAYHSAGRHRTWTVPVETLGKLHDLLVDTLSNLTDELATGDHCLYCPGARSSACPAWRTAAYNALDVVQRGTCEEPDEATLARELDMFKRAESLISLHSQFLTDVATARLTAGRQVPGYRMAPRYGHRVWTDLDALRKEVDPDGKLTWHEPAKPITPAKAEKLKGADGKAIGKDTVTKYTKKPAGKPALEKFTPDAPAPPPPVDTPAPTD